MILNVPHTSPGHEKYLCFQMAIVIGNFLALWNGAARTEKGLFVGHSLCCSIIPAYLNDPGTEHLAAVSGPLRDHISIGQSARLHNLETSHGIAQEQNIILV